MSAQDSPASRVDRVLIVDDDPTARLLAREALERSGFHVAEAGNGREALRLVESESPDIVILDVMMPEMDGFAACAAMRARPSGRHLPVLIMTGLNDIDSINRAYETGATDFATKPINFPLLPQRVRYLLRGKRIADELRASKARLENTQHIAQLARFDWDLDTGRLKCSPRLNDLFGAPPDTAITTPEALLAYIHPEDRSQFTAMVEKAFDTCGNFRIEHRIIRADGAVRILRQEGEIASSREGRAVRLWATIEDVTERRQMERQLRRLEHYDEITGLPNRALLNRHLAETIDRARREHRAVAVMVIDLDNFSRINDTLGYSAGDELLKVLAGRLDSCLSGRARLRGVPPEALPADDLVARIGADEFVVVLADVQEQEDAAIMARRMRAAIALPCPIGPTEVTMTASAGISGVALDGQNAETLIKQADAAMHHAKRHGRDRYELSNASINSRASERLAMENELRRALAAGEFELHYQPKVQLAGMITVGMEALVRWRHPEHGMVSPSVFVPVAEEIGLIVPLGEWILHEACRQTREWERSGLPPLVVSVNLSAVQLRARGLHAVVGSILQDTGLDPSRLELELTESLLMEERDTAIQLMHKMRLLGISVSIDDFGTGYSSLAYLKRFPINALKIDRSFVSDLGAGDDGVIASAIIALAHSLHMKVIAEGVETEAQCRFLANRNCEEIQGYYFSRPLPPAAFSAWVHQHANAPPAPKLLSK